MDDDFKKWVAYKARGTDEPLLDAQWDLYELQYLVRAMWAINREKKYIIWIQERFIFIDTADQINGADIALHFYYTDYNSETEALTAALKYIWEQTK